MGFKSKKGEGKKKKGPKGKRARAKAKLERQWGETVDESKVTGLRRGKSRLLQHEPTTRTRPSKINEESDDDSHASSEESEVGDDGPALNRLLQSIKKESRNVGHGTEQSCQDDISNNESSDEESESERSSEDSRSMDYEVEKSDEEAQVSDDDSDKGGASSDVDPFAFHFNREPHSEKELVQAIAGSTKTSKALFPEIDSCFEFQLTDDNAEDASTLFRFNRQILQRAWKRINGPVVRSSSKKKKEFLSPFQGALYPSLATYKDALLAAETREVCSVPFHYT